MGPGAGDVNDRRLREDDVLGKLKRVDARLVLHRLGLELHAAEEADELLLAGNGDHEDRGGVLDFVAEDDVSAEGPVDVEPLETLFAEQFFQAVIELLERLVGEVGAGGLPDHFAEVAHEPRDRLGLQR